MSPSDGGLVRALKPILRGSRGCWIGWPGSDYDERLAIELKDWSLTESYSLEPVFLSADEQNGFYKGFSNEIIWPLFHGFSTRCSFNFEYWNYYREVNARFTSTIARQAAPGDFIWIHDYHLMLVGGMLRVQGLHRDLAYFHHIPFPSPDVFEILPWRVPILRALTQFTVIGFQTARDQRNFAECVRHWLPDTRIRNSGDKYLVDAGDHWATVGVYPISIDQESFSCESTNPSVLETTESIKKSLGTAKLIFSVDRLDYTKGIVERLSAYRTLLQRYPELRGRVTLIQIVVPSREDIAEYHRLRLRIENVISNINGEYARPGWVPVQYFYRSIPRTDLIAYYRAADVASVTPLRDGMNLVAKEFCACRSDGRGTLILSEFAGAVEELRNGALVVNPYDVEGVAETLRSALYLSESEQRDRMIAMRSQLRTGDIFRWAQSFVDDCLKISNLARPDVREALRACS